MKENLRQLIYKKGELEEDLGLGEIANEDSSGYPIHDLKSGAGDAKVANIKKVANRLKLLQEVGLPTDLFSDLVYVNTLMTQEMLAEPAWQQRMTDADWRGLTPLFYGHVNPYGVFDLDMDVRIPLAEQLQTVA